MATRVTLDTLGQHVLEFDGMRATLRHAGGDRRSRLADALMATLEVGGVPLAGAPSVVTVNEKLSIAGRSIAPPLSPFACRYLADFRRLPPPARDADYRPRTDLHTHFSGCLRPDDLLRIGIDADVAYPPEVLAAAGIRARSPMRLATMPSAFQRRLVEQLSIPLDRRVPFDGLERIYRFRSVITKHPGTFLPQLEQIARDYAEMGVRYVELSLSNVVEAARLRQLVAEVPRIQETSGVTLRFLGALSRHDDLEWDLDYLDRLVSLRDCGLIVGLDFMGKESNATRVFDKQLRRAAELGIPLRVHAGENAGYPLNVRDAVEIVCDAGGTLRVGHGLFGGDDETLALLRETQTIVEFNLNSNLALNNIQAVWQIPLVRYVEAGVPVVLGTDGYGMYGTSPAAEAEAATRAGLNADGMERIRVVEARILSAIPKLMPFEVPDDAPPRHFTPEVAARADHRRREVRQRLVARLRKADVELVEDVPGWLNGRKPLSLAGAWRKSWQTVSPLWQRRVQAILAEVLSSLPPEEWVLVTGGTEYGVEGVAAGVAPGGLAHLGAIVEQSPSERLAVRATAIVGEALHDKAAGLYGLLAELGGQCVFIGGGNIVSDEIQTARNLRVPYHLMVGPEGAADTHARQDSRNGFTDAQTLLERLHRPQVVAPLWRPGVNPAVDVVVVRGDEVLLIRRDVDAPCEGGRWALPGGFVESDAPWDAPWEGGRESPTAAARRELLEETGLRAGALVPVGVYEGGGRDPRDSATSWVRSHAFRAEVGPEPGPLIGGDDAADVGWFPIRALPTLAFDHARIIAEAVK